VKGNLTYVVLVDFTSWIRMIIIWTTYLSIRSICLMLCNDRMPPYPRPGRFRPTVAILKIICFLQSVNMLIKNVLADPKRTQHRPLVVSYLCSHAISWKFPNEKFDNNWGLDMAPLKITLWCIYCSVQHWYRALDQGFPTFSQPNIT